MALNRKKKIFKTIALWRLRNIKDRQFIIILSIIIGLAVGIAAVVIKNSVLLIENLLHVKSTYEYQVYLYFAYPVIGISLAVIFMRYVIRKQVGHGIPTTLYAISKNNAIIERHNLFSSIVTSALTVGFGGSVGLEGPTVATGGAIGSNIGRFARLNYRQMAILIACASAGAMSAIFKAPIAAIVFTVEVIMLDLTLSSIIPLLFSSATAALTSYFFLGQNVLYPFQLEDKFVMPDLPFYILLGVLSGMLAVYFTRTYIFINSIFEKMKNPLEKLLYGGAALGIIIFFLPALYGEGYEGINSSLKGDFSYLFKNSLYFEFQDNFAIVMILILLVVLFKVVATSITFGAGGIGGIFAPTLFMGANFGLLYAKSINYFGGNISESNFALVGMAGMIAGVLHAPLTAIFLIAEITSGYGLFMPLMITASISYATIKYFQANSVYTYQLAERGELFTHNKDKVVLSLMKIDRLIEKNFKTVDIDGTLGDLVKVITKSSRNIFPVVDDENNFHGIVTLDTIREIMFKQELYNEVYVRNLMYTPSVTVAPDESMEDVAHKIQNSGYFNVPVLKDGKYIGFVSRANVFSTYRRMLRDFSED